MNSIARLAMKNPAAIRGLILIFGLLALGGCARPALSPLELPPAETVWNRFLAGVQDPPKAFELIASLHYTAEDQHRRMTLQFWGNPSYPLRLDLAAGIGAPIASWREDGQGFTAYFHQEQTAYVESDRDKLAEGLGLPFTLRDLALLVTGSYQQLAPSSYQTAEPVATGYSFRFSEDPYVGALTIGPDGRPLGMASPDGVWKAEFITLEQTPPWIPRKVTFTSSDGRRIALFVKKMEPRGIPFPAASLDLKLPPDTRLAPLPSGDKDQPANFL